MTPDEISKLDAIRAEWKQNQAEQNRLREQTDAAINRLNEIGLRQQAIKAEILRMTCPDAFRDTLSGAIQANPE